MMQIISWVPISLLRFGIIGTMGLFVDMAILYTLIWGLAGSLIISKIFAFIGSATFTWWMNRNYTFVESGKPLFYEWLNFLGTNAIGGIVNFIVYSLIVTWFFYNNSWLPAVATTFGSLCGMIFNYLTSRYWVFSNQLKL